MGFLFEMLWLYRGSGDDLSQDTYKLIFEILWLYRGSGNDLSPGTYEIVLEISRHNFYHT